MQYVNVNKNRLLSIFDFGSAKRVNPLITLFVSSFIFLFVLNLFFDGNNPMVVLAAFCFEGLVLAYVFKNFVRHDVKRGEGL